MAIAQRSGLNSLLWAVVLVLFVVGVYGNYYYTDVISFAVRLAIGIVFFLVLVLFASFTQQGKRFWQFSRDARMEMRKVVWPTRKEVVQTTVLVIVMVIVTALVLWGVDSFLLWAVKLLTGQ